MKIICTSQKLKEAVEHTERIVTRHLTLPILNNLLLKTDKNGLKIISTNLEIGVVSWFPCKVVEAGAITIPAKIFSGIVSALNDDKVSLNSKNNNTLEISTENIGTRQVIVSDIIRQEFETYHRDNAKLRAVHKSINMKTSLQNNKLFYIT